MKPATERRQRKDYRFSPETLHQIDQGRRLAQATDETAFVEEAILHYVSLLNSQTDVRELEQPQASILHQVERTELEQSRQPITRKKAVSLPAESPTPHSPSRSQPAYQIFVKHEPGPHPSLPAGLAYIDQHQSIQPEQCPTHRVFAQSCTIATARQRLEQLKAVPGLIALRLLDKNGATLPRDTWRMDQGHWVRND